VDFTKFLLVCIDSAVNSVICGAVRLSYINHELVEDRVVFSSVDVFLGDRIRVRPYAIRNLYHVHRYEEGDTSKLLFPAGFLGVRSRLNN